MAPSSGLATSKSFHRWFSLPSFSVALPSFFINPQKEEQPKHNQDAAVRRTTGSTSICTTPNNSCTYKILCNTKPPLPPTPPPSLPATKALICCSQAQLLLCISSAGDRRRTDTRSTHSIESFLPQDQFARLDSSFQALHAASRCRSQRVITGLLHSHAAGH